MASLGHGLVLTGHGGCTLEVQRGGRRCPTLTTRVLPVEGRECLEMEAECLWFAHPTGDTMVAPQGGFNYLLCTTLGNQRMHLDVSAILQDRW